MPRVSVVVPIYNVEGFLEECLTSLERQTFGDLEVVMVDDGSTDGGPAIAESFAARDPRFKLISQPNGGLSKARNTGLDAATGEFLAFADSDDVLALNAYELLLGALDETGSDFASGNVHRLRGSSTRQAGFLARAFRETRLKTHITQHRALLADRTAWNKLWRRSFWDAHGRRFPEGRTYEDIPVVLPLHFAAHSVDVLSDVVYYWRTRHRGGASITERRTEPRALEHRIAAIEEVSRYLDRHGPRKAKRWYDASVVSQDLHYFLNVLDEGDDAYQAFFLDRVNAFLDGVSPRVYRDLAAILRLKWHLVRERRLPELLEVLRFAREEIYDTPPVRIRGRWYGDYPFRTDAELRIPRSVYRIGRELKLFPRLERLTWEDGKLRLEGWAFISSVGAARPRAQRVTLTALPPGPLKRVRLQTVGIRMRAASVHRPELTTTVGGEISDVSWSGFVATLDPRRLRTAGRRGDRTWNLYITVKVGRLKRRRSRFRIDPARPLAATECRVRGGAVVTTARAPGGAVTLCVRAEWATLRGHRRNGDELELHGELQGGDSGELRLEARRRDRPGRHRYPLTLELDGPIVHFTARVPLADLVGAAEPGPDAVDEEIDGDDDDEDTREGWELSLVGGGRRRSLTLAPDAPEGVFTYAGEEIAFFRSIEDGGATLLARPRGATISDARWEQDGTLELEGEVRLPPGPHELVLLGRQTWGRHVFALPAGASGGRFAVRLTPARIPSLAGELPLREDAWDLHVRREGEDDAAPVVLADGLYERLPVATVIERKRFALGMTPGRDAALLVSSDLDADENGRRQQRRLQLGAYAGRRGEPLREQVVYSSFSGRQYSDNPRAIHEELVRRDAPLTHLWVVSDGRCRVPDSAHVLRFGSRAHYEAFATSRYVVVNDHFPDWFERRPDQLCLQTWHGTPLKQLGFDVESMRNEARRFSQRWDRHVGNWQFVLSPNRFTTPILRRAYALEGEVLESGYPRNDVLARPDRDAASRRVRERLGIPDGVRVVLYAPTYRDHVRDDRGRYHLERALDIDRLRAAVGRDTIVLFRKHHYIADPVPVTADGFVRDVSDFPDGTELMLAADVLVTDYSSMMFDFANTGRPMLFFTYDLDAYRDEIRGFYFDFEQRAPGPLLRTTDELAAALRDLDTVTAEYAGRYRAFAAAFCELDDGHAAARVADRLFGS